MYTLVTIGNANDNKLEINNTCNGLFLTLKCVSFIFVFIPFWTNSKINNWNAMEISNLIYLKYHIDINQGISQKFVNKIPNIKLIRCQENAIIWNILKLGPEIFKDQKREMEAALGNKVFREMYYLSYYYLIESMINSCHESIQPQKC